MNHFVPEFVNRHQHLDAFQKLLAGELKREVFLIKGTPEIGKSFLLDQFWYMVGLDHLSRLDFRDGETHNFLSLIQAAISDLGAQAFPDTLAEIHRITQETRHDIRFRTESVHAPGAHPGSQITVGDVDNTGEVNIVSGNIFKGDVFLPPTDNILQRQEFQLSVSSTFFRELHKLAEGCLIFLSYDSFEDAPVEAQQWLTGSLLDELAQGSLPGVIVILAGRVIPDVSHMNMLIPRTVITELKNFDEEAAREYWVRCRGLPLEALRSIYEQTQGHPKRLAEKANEAGGAPLTYRVLEI